MFIITKTIEDARWICGKLTYRLDPNPYGWDQGWVDSRNADMFFVEWWKGEQPPVFGDKLGFYQTGTVEELHEQVLAYVKPITERKKAVLTEIKAKCPHLTLEEFDHLYGFGCRVFVGTYGGSSSHPFNLLQPDILELALGAEAVMVFWQQLQANYPHLTFYPGTISNINAHMEREKQAKAWPVSIRGTNTQTEVFVPLSDADKLELDRLETEAAKPDTFFCTECRCSQPKSEYAGFHFAKVLCKKHASPEWLKMARAETYD